MAETTKFTALVGLDYINMAGEECRAEVGDSVIDPMPSSARWLVEQNIIQPAKAPARKKTTKTGDK